MSEPKTKLEIAATTVQVLSVVVAAVISVMSFNDSRDKEAAARGKEARARESEALTRALEAN